MDGCGGRLLRELIWVSAHCGCCYFPRQRIMLCVRGKDSRCAQARRLPAARVYSSLVSMVDLTWLVALSFHWCDFTAVMESNMELWTKKERLSPRHCFGQAIFITAADVKSGHLDIPYKWNRTLLPFVISLFHVAKCFSLNYIIACAITPSLWLVEHYFIVCVDLIFFLSVHQPVHICFSLWFHCVNNFQHECKNTFFWIHT